MCFEDLGMVIAAGGSGSRFGRSQNKLLADFRGEALMICSLRTFLPLLRKGYVVIAAPENLLETMKEIVDKALPDNQIKWSIGGATRLASVYKAQKLLPGDCRLIAVHDAARPLATAELLKKLYEAASEAEGAIPGAPPVDTVKQIDENGFIKVNLVRKELLMAATPQVFQLDKYRKSLEQLPEDLLNGTREDARLTDDAAFFTAAGYKVKAVVSQAPNPKITYQSDL